MLRKLSRKLSGARTHDNSEEFASIDARQHDEALARQEATRAQRAQSPIFAQHSFDLDEELVANMERFHMGRAIDALDLTNLVDPTLKRMRPLIAPSEALLPPPPRHNRTDATLSHAEKEVARPALAMQPHRRLDRDAVILSRPVPGITITPAEDIGDPMEALDYVTPLPARGDNSRPLLRRNAVSYREQRDIPLRVQAVRRAHQEEYARQISQRPLLAQVPRRGSEPILQHRSRPVLTPDVQPQRPTMQRVASSQRHMQPQRGANMARRGSSSRVEHLDRPRMGQGGSARRRDYFAESPQTQRDFYLDAAAADWSIADDLQLL